MRAVIADRARRPRGPDRRRAARPRAGPGRGADRRRRDGRQPRRPPAAQGFYPPPPGRVRRPRAGVQRHRRGASARASTGWAVGDEVCALLAGGGYAEQVAVPAGQLMPVPDGVDLVTAAALPEVACTVWSNVFMVAGLQPEETLLVHGGAGGIGTFAIQLAAAARRPGAHHGRARPEKLAVCAGARRRRGDQLPRAGLRRGGPRGDRRPRRRRHPRQHGRASTSAATSPRSPPRAGW